MTYAELRTLFRQSLSALYPPEEVRAIFHLYVESRYQLLPAYLYLSLNESVPATAPVESDVQRLREGEPIQYVLGEATFCDLTLEVNPAVLIPRPETAELVAAIQKHYANRPPAHLIDLGTGSGAIAIALAKAFPKCDLWAADFSAAALDTARRNAQRHQTPVRFLSWDIFNEPPVALPLFDLIVSNPPYIPANEKAAMHCNVTDYEPASALFVPDRDPLLFYRRIAELGRERLVYGGSIFVEIHEKLARETLALFSSFGYGNVELRHDFNGKARIVKAEK